MKEFEFEIVQAIRGTRILGVVVEAESLEEAEKMVEDGDYEETYCDFEYDTTGLPDISLIEETLIEHED